MLLYEYALTTNFSLIELHEKSDLLLKKLRAHFKEENLGDNIDVLFELQEKLYPSALRKRKEGVLTKLFTAMDITEAEAVIGVLDTSQEFHSPCVLLIIDVDDDGHRIIKSSHLKMFTGTASTYQFPTCSAVLLQVLSPYFIFDMTYPSAYNSILRFIERNIHGFLCETTRGLPVKQEYTNFVKKFDAK